MAFCFSAYFVIFEPILNVIRHERAPFLDAKVIYGGG